MTKVNAIKKIQDIEKIKNILLKKSFRDYMLFCFGINSGLRISDILSLNVIDVRDKDYISLVEKKTKKLKRFPINCKLKQLFRNYTNNKNSNMPLFETKFHNRLDRISAYRILNNACKQVKIKENVGTHTLRKTFGYHHYKKFKDVAILQKIFNHSSPLITLRYIGIDQDIY